MKSLLLENLADRCGFVDEPEKAAVEETEQASTEPILLSEATQRIAGFVTKRPVVETVESNPEIDDKRLMFARAGFTK